MRVVTDTGDAYLARFNHRRVGFVCQGRYRNHRVIATTSCYVARDGTDPLEPVAFGVAHCSEADRYDGRRGETLALQRALDASGIDRADWPVFFRQLAARYRRPGLPTGGRAVLARAEALLRRGEIDVTDLELLIGDARGRRP